MVDEIQLVSENGNNPITLENAKTFLEVNGNDDDELISDLIDSATRFMEDYCQVSLKAKSMKLVVSGMIQVDLPFYPVDSSSITLTDESANSITNFDRLGDTKPHIIYSGSDSHRYEIAYNTTAETSNVWKTACYNLVKSMYNNSTLEPVKEDVEYLTAIKLIEPYKLY